MANEAAKARLVELMESVRAGMDSIARAQRTHARATATATAANRRVTVTVNADGVVVETKLGSGAQDLTLEEMAQAFTAAAQDAALQMRKKTQELVDTVRQDNMRLPRLSEFLPGMPDVQDMMPTAPAASLEPPQVKPRLAIADDVPAPMEYVDVERWRRDSSAATPSDIAESGW
ncbi:YbaB/EbfC family nucleoid-associated protein [Nocardia sp. NPDC052566]|uniref:YbaB/EbfC family nucleoid-associated protein n=1 Tax=Nocardia sp. NPDC052566 TaxID=3364330 RepID=UPI0037C60F56